MLDSGVLFEEGLGAYLVAAASYLIAAAAAVTAYRLEAYIEGKWGRVLREDPGWLRRDALTLVAMAVIALLGVIVIRLLLSP